MPEAREREPEPAPPPPKGRRKLMIGGVVAGVMLLEGVMVFVAVKMFSGQTPATAQAAEHALPPDAAGTHAAPVNAHDGNPGNGHGGQQAQVTPGELGDAEIELACFQAPNLKSGRACVYDVCMVARVSGPNVQRFELLKAQKTNEITARLCEIIRCASPEHLKEDRLETIRRQTLHVLAEVLGEAGLIDEILITRWMVFFAE